MADFSRLVNGLSAPPNGDGRPALLGPDGRPYRGQEDGYVFEHYRSFAAIFNLLTRTYRWQFDEALKQDPCFALTMRRDCFLMALLQERYLAVCNLPWRLEPEDEDDPAQAAVAEELTDVLKVTPDFLSLRLYLSEAVFYGRYGSQVRYGRLPGTPYYGVTGHYPINGDKIQWDWEANPLIYVNATWAYDVRHPSAQERDAMKSSPFARPGVLVDNPQLASTVFGDRAPMLRLADPELRQRFVIHKNPWRDDADYFESEQGGRAWGVGLRDRLFWCMWLRNKMIEALSGFMLRIGLNGLILFYYDADNPAAQKAAEDAANSSNDRTAIAMPVTPGRDRKSNTAEVITSPVQGVEQLRSITADYWERHMERLVIGQSMSAGADHESGLGGSGRAKLAANTKYNLIRTDADALAETLTTDLVAPLQRLNFPQARFRVAFKIDVPDYEADEKLKAAKVLFEMGVPVLLDELREAAGFSRPEPGDETTLAGGMMGQPPDPGQGDGAEGQSAPSPPGLGLATPGAGPGVRGHGPDGKPPAPGIGLAGPGRASGVSPPGRLPTPARLGMAEYAAEFDESKHPRKATGKFAPKGQGEAGGGDGQGHPGDAPTPGPPPAPPPPDPAAGRPSKPGERKKGEPPILPYRPPPPPQGQPGGKAGGLSATGATNTRIGDLAEAALTQLGLRSILPPGKRQNPLDAEWDHTGYAFEIKACTTKATEYKAKMKSKEVASKRTYASKNGLRPATLIAVVDVEAGEVHAYWRPGIGSYKLSGTGAGFYYMGTARLGQ